MFKPTARQQEAQVVLAGNATHNCLFGGSRSGKTFLLVRNIVLRALKAPDSRHAIFRFRFNSLKASVILDTFPKVMTIAFPGVAYDLNKTDFYVTFANKSQIWFAGLDDKERTEKILGMEFGTVYFNEASQIPYASIQMALTRLAQLSTQVIADRPDVELKPRAYYDLNPPTKAHWSYKLFIEHKDPETKKPVSNPEDYASFQINPLDNAQNLTSTYLATLQAMSPNMRRRFLDGEYTDDNPNALFSYENIELNRVIDTKLPEFIRVVVGVDPSGAGENDTTEHDAIGIVVGALGTDGRAYLLEDCTVTAPPAVWGRIATTAYDRHQADCIVGESNFGGAMVNHTIQTSRARTPYKEVRASRGKHVRAEPISALYYEGKVRHVGYFPELEDELCAFSTMGYIGSGSPNRSDAWVWVLAELFSAIVAPREKKQINVPKYKPRDMSVGY
jgi:phage terminase large subunit-like protein